MAHNKCDTNTKSSLLNKAGQAQIDFITILDFE